MTQLRVTGRSVELVAGTLEIVRAEAAGNQQLERALGARVPPEWPPELVEPQVVAFWIDRLAEGESEAGWWPWYIVQRAGVAEGRVLVGGIGFKGPPGPSGVVEVGYSVLEAFQRRGYATEALAGLLGWAFSHPSVTAVCAETFEELVPSIRVLQKAGFAQRGEAVEPGAIRFELTRAQWEAGTAPAPA